MPATEAQPATLIGGPGHDATITDPGRDRVYVAMRLVPLLDEDGRALTLPTEQGDATERLLNQAAQRWELYERAPGADGVYVWVEP